MSSTLTLRAIDIPSSLHKFGIGFDSLFEEMNRTVDRQTTNYPPYNIVKYDENTFAIELAIAGFKEGDVDIVTENNQLTITGNKIPSLNGPDIEYVVHGISAKSFTRTFTLAEHVVVLGATVEDGILTIKLERQIPEEKKPRSISIAYKK